MLKRKLLIASALVTALIFGIQANSFAASGKADKKEARFTVRIENVSEAGGLAAHDGSRYPFALSPGLYVLSEKKMNFFKLGKKATAGLEAQAEDGNPEILSKQLLPEIGSPYMGIFNTPVGAKTAAPILPGGSYEFSFAAKEGMKLNVIAMYGQSNDLYYAPLRAIDLFEKGKPLSGDITDKFILFDAGTEVNESPGVGANQAPRQKMPNTGAAENGVVSFAKDGFAYPNTRDVLRITVSQE